MLDALNALPPGEAATQLLAVCGSRRWVAEMLKDRPFASRDDLHARAQAAWDGLTREDRLEAFAAHPRIGETQTGSGALSAGWSRAEQSAMDAADAQVRARIAELNRLYEQRFGYIFIMCATGRRPNDMLRELETRLTRTPEEELRIAAAEQAQIMHLRLDKLCSQKSEV